MKKKFIWYLFFVVIVFFLIFLYLINSLIYSTNNKFKNNFLSLGRDKPEENQPDTKTNVDFNNIKKNSEDSQSGEAESQTINSESPDSCYTDKVAYSIGDIREFYICNLEEENKCIDKIAKCSVKVNNFDNEISGIFEVKFTFFEKQNMSNVISTSLVGLFVGSKDMKLFNSEELIQGEDADKNLSCHYSTTKVPRKKICV